MAQKAIEDETNKRGYECKIETQGSMGIENELEQYEIDEADVVILAIAIGIDGDERFDEKRDENKVLVVEPGEVLKKVAIIMDELINL